MNRKMTILATMLLIAVLLAACVPVPAPPEPAAAGVNTEVVRALIVQNDLTVGGTINGVSSVVMEGATDDTYETTFAVTDPTADRTITIPNSTGTVALNPYGASIEFEGATADDFETTLAVTDPTADVTITLPKETAAAMVSSLTTNATDAANAVTGQSNALRFEGATANDYETIITPTDPTADVTLTAPNETGTLALTSQAVDMTLEADSTGGNAGAKTEYIGLPRIKLIGGAQGTNPGSQTISLVDDSPAGEWAAVDASTTLSADGTYYKYGSNSLKVIWDVGAVATDGFIDAALGAGAAWDDMESVGLLVYSTATWAAGDLTLVLTDDGGARTYNIPALTAANIWTWLEVDISAGDLSAVSDVAILMSAAGETALGAFSMYVDIAWTWDAVDEEALGTAVIQDGVLSVINTEGGVTLADQTDYIVHYESGNDFIVYITDQSGADIAVLAAY